ncbi:MAG TPA: archaellum operon transcriptional activator EarA family protein [Methanocella sp.]|nr:archaellum operon transcriptional activator EarA family protein [Methanocella sp.]
MDLIRYGQSASEFDKMKDSKTEVLLYLDNLFPASASIAKISSELVIDKAIILKALDSSWKNFGHDKSLLELGLAVRVKKGSKVEFAISEKGRRLAYKMDLLRP